MRRDEFTFAHTLRVRWGEVDAQNVVFNANYFLFFDVAVTEYWRAIGFNYPKDILERFGTDIYAVKASAEFHASATYDDVLDVCCRVRRIGRSSMALVLGLYRGSDHLTSGELVYVNADPGSRKSAPWPPALRQAILAYERTAPEQPEAMADGGGR